MECSGALVLRRDVFLVLFLAHGGPLELFCQLHALVREKNICFCRCSIDILIFCLLSKDSRAGGQFLNSNVGMNLLCSKSHLVLTPVHYCDIWDLISKV